MDALALKRKRMHIRQSTISGALPGNLVEHGTERKIEAWPLDVSPRGLGVLIKMHLAPGTRLQFKTHNISISLEVINCQAHLGIENLYRCGLFVRDPDINLQQTFASLGLLPEDHSMEAMFKFI